MTDALVSRSMRARPWIGIALLLAAGVVLFLPAVRAPLFLDDYMQASMVEGSFPSPRFGAFDLYDFVNDTDRALLYERGVLPWWTEPDLQIRFFRPLSSALLWADHSLFHGSPLPLHVHSLLWWVAAVLAARLLYRRLLTPRVALIATIIYALAPCHVFPIAWLANREALVSIVFGIPALAAYVRWREGRRPRDAAVSAGLFALSLAGGEYAICFAGYVVAFELVTRGERLARRGLGLLPFVGPTAVYLAVRAALGYGAHGSGYYADPFLEPSQFSRVAARRAATLLAEAWGGLHGLVFDDDTPSWKIALTVVLGGAILFWPLRRMLARLDEGPRKTATWLLLGAHLALVPVLPAAPRRAPPLRLAAGHRRRHRHPARSDLVPCRGRGATRRRGAQRPRRAGPGLRPLHPRAGDLVAHVARVPRVRHARGVPHGEARRAPAGDRDVRGRRRARHVQLVHPSLLARPAGSRRGRLARPVADGARPGAAARRAHVRPSSPCRTKAACSPRASPTSSAPTRRRSPSARPSASPTRA